MTAWFLVIILALGTDGSPSKGLLIDNYKDQATCETVKSTAKDQPWYPALICIERKVLEA